MSLKKTMTIAWTLALLLPLLFPYIQPKTSIKADRRNENGSNNSITAVPIRTTSTVHHSGLPKVDDIYYKCYPGSPPEDIVDEFLAGETDWINGPYRWDLHSKVLGNNTYGAVHKVSPMDPVAQFEFIVINCRDYKERSGEPNSPLNDSNLRIALSYIYGMERKEADVDDYFKTDWRFAIGNPVPPAQEPWYNASIQMPVTNWTKAWSILQTADYYINSTENWLYRNGAKMRNMTVSMSSACSHYWPDAPGGGFARAFNEFITTYLGADGPIMKLKLVDFGSLVRELLNYHDFDFLCIGLANQGRYVDWLYDCLHSDNIRNGGWNFGGIHDPDFDNWTEMILTSLDVDEIIYAASKIQEKFVHELMPWIPVGSGKEFCTTARDSRGELMNVIPMPNYGPINPWSYMTIHWKGEPDIAWPGGTVTVALEDTPDTLNPYTENTPYGWQMLDRATIGLTMLEPVNLTNMPFVATDWEISHWTSIPELGIVDGSTATFWLRQDVKWHDGEPVTAYDCVANMRFMREHQPGRYSKVWAHLVYEEVDGPYEFGVFFDETSLYYTEYVAEAALLVPEHMIKLVEATFTDYRDWLPCDNAYADLMGVSPPAAYPWMTQLVGAGPFVFHNYDRGSATGRVTRYNEFFVNAPVIGSVVGEWQVNPLESYAYKPLVQNVGAKEANENGTLTAVTVDVKVYEDDVLAHEIDGLRLDPWNWTYLGPYTMRWENVSCGPHTVRVEVFDHNDSSLIHNYTHLFVATIKEDITTCSGELLDFKVDMRDVGRYAKGFGSYPGHPRWDAVCDANHDFKVDMRDIGAVARRFGWSCYGH